MDHQLSDHEHTIAALRDLMVVEGRLAGNSQHLQQVRQAIFLRWRIMAAFIALFWCLSRLTELVAFSLLFYFFLFTFIVLIGISLNSGRLFSAEQYRQDCTAALLPFNMILDTDRLCFAERVPIGLHQLVT